MTSSLISPLFERNDDIELNGERNHNNSSVTGRKEILEEVQRQLRLAGPLILVNLLEYSIQIISVMFVGHLGKLSLSGASIATSFASVTGLSLLLGMASALDTFCGQSYGAKQYHMLGLHMQRAMLVLLLVSIPLAIIWANTRTILIVCGQDKEIASVAGIYAQFMIPSVFAYGLLQCLNKFLQTQNIVFPMMLCSGLATLLHILFCWILIFKSGLGIRGAALANSISSWINVLLLIIYVKFSSSCAETWTGFSKEAFRNVLTFFRLAIPSAIMVWYVLFLLKIKLPSAVTVIKMINNQPIIFYLCYPIWNSLEVWSFESVVLLSGLLPNPQLETSVLSISLDTAAAVWMIPYGLSGAVSTRVSNELGAGRPKLARLAVGIFVVIVVVEGILVGIFLISARNILGYAFSNEIEVIKYIAVMLPIIAASNFLDGLQSLLSGIARGCGRQKIGAYINLGSYYLVGIPCAILFTFVLHIGGKGLWFGIICALLVQVFSLSAITIRTNWEQEAKKAKERVYDAMIPADTVY